MPGAFPPPFGDLPGPQLHPPCSRSAHAPLFSPLHCTSDLARAAAHEEAVRQPSEIAAAAAADATAHAVHPPPNRVLGDER